MLEKLPDVLGHVLHGQRAGLDQTAFRSLPLRAGQGAIAVASLAFPDHAPIPADYTADGEGRSPPLHWSGVPASAQAVLLFVEDGDSPSPHPFVHAIALGLPVGDGSIPEGALVSQATSGLTLGRNSMLGTGWLPPDPPPGHGVHHYAFQVFALDAPAGVSGTPGREEVLDLLREHAIASGCLIGTYERPDGKEPAAGAATAAA